jgi:hypothetical protein
VPRDLALDRARLAVERAGVFEEPRRVGQQALARGG